MSGAILSLPQYVFMAWYSVKKHRDNFTFSPLSFTFEVLTDRSEDSKISLGPVKER
jgi:hypothetical protein